MTTIRQGALPRVLKILAGILVVPIAWFAVAALAGWDPDPSSITESITQLSDLVPLIGGAVACLMAFLIIWRLPARVLAAVVPLLLVGCGVVLYASLTTREVARTMKGPVPTATEASRPAQAPAPTVSAPPKSAAVEPPTPGAAPGSASPPVPAPAPVGDAQPRGAAPGSTPTPSKSVTARPVAAAPARPGAAPVSPAPQAASPPPAAAAKPPESGLPQFPWPPPRASASYVLPRTFFAATATLGQVTTAIVSALETRGYVERSFFSTTGDGVALVTRLERIDDDGSPLAESDRWPAGLKENQAAQSLGGFLRGLFYVNRGRYRVIVFILQDIPFAQSSETVTGEDARTWLRKGANALPREVADRPFGSGTCTALVYEFESDGTAVRVVDSQLTGKQHLEKAGVLALLGKAN